jgi:HK97 gp10 family phage protein
MRVKATVRGMDELKRELDRLDDAMQGRMLRNCTMAGARVGAKVARTLAPVGETGDLKRSIKARWAGADRKSTRKEALVNAKVFYARFVEMGTQFIAPRSFMRKAVDENQDQIITKMALNLVVGIDRELRRQGVREDPGET